MALSQRPASRFFAAFYRWNIHTQRSDSCSLSCQYTRDGRRYPVGSYLRKYHATRLLRQQDQPEPQLQNEGTSAASKGIQNHATRDSDRRYQGRPPTTAQEETPTKQKVSATKKEESPTELLGSDHEEQELKKAVRSVLRKVPSSVAVITVESVDPDTKKHVPMGVAVSSLSSVTLDPPTISFNIKQPSQTLDAIRAANGLFRVHFPGANRGGANVVEHFCRGNHPDAYSSRTKDLKLFVPSHENDERATASLAPQIWNDSICAAMECTVTHEFPVADHIILAARVDSLEQGTSKDRNIIYVDGKYMRSDTTIAVHGTSKTFAQSEGNWSVWDYSLFPGEQVRKDYAEYIKTIIKDNPVYLDKPIKETYRQLELELPYPPSNLGIHAFDLLGYYKQEKGHKDEHEARKDVMPVLSEFYGRLSPPAMAKIMNRAKRLVKEDPRFLFLNYRVFLHHLSVHAGSWNLLPSDFMNALRAEGLAREFESRKEVKETGDRKSGMERLEQTEHRLREYLRDLDFKRASEIRLEDVMELLGENKVTAFYFKRARSRLLAESHPRQYDITKVDIVGDVTQEEARVVLGRIIRYLQVENNALFRKRINMPATNALHLSGVHPAITGMDIEYLFGKIKHLYHSTREFCDFAGAIDKMLEPWFENTLDWDALEKRVKQFVQKIPLRATSWSNQDKLAAMGLTWEATVKVPIENNQRSEQPLNKGLLLDTLIAKELKNHYGKGTDEENQAIARYLKETYNFDVHSKPGGSAPKDSANASSSDDMQEAMMASLNVDVLNGKRTEHGVANPRIRYHSNQNTGRSGQQNIVRMYDAAPHEQSMQESPPKRSTGAGWTTYTLGKGKK